MSRLFRVRAARAVGRSLLTGPRMDAIGEFVEREARAGSWPGGAWVVEEGGRTLSAGAAGLRALEPGPLPAEPDTIYDLASLTKPLATAALAALLEQDGRLSLDAPVADLLPGLACARSGRPTVRDLALHRSGLPAWRPLYAVAGTPDAVLNTVVRLEPEYACGARVVYSDPGYILLGEIVRKAGGGGLAAQFRERIAAPLGLVSLGFNPASSLRARIAPTEKGNRYEERSGRLARGAPARLAPARLAHPRRGPRRQRVGARRGRGARGPVRDRRPRSRGSLASSSARERVCSGRARSQAFRENLTPGLEEARTFGWKRAVAGAREAEGVLPAEAFGHAGFTGTSVWLDPGAGRSYVLLTNRVHPEVKPTDMTGLRRRFHELARGLR